MKKVMKAKFDSECYIPGRSARLYKALCGGIKAGDEIIFSVGHPAQISQDGFTRAPDKRVTTVGHLACRIEDIEERSVAPLIKIMKGQPNPASDEIIEGIAQELRKSWL